MRREWFEGEFIFLRVAVRSKVYSVRSKLYFLYITPFLPPFGFPFFGGRRLATD
jgi:hypothetical protein